MLSMIFARNPGVPEAMSDTLLVEVSSSPSGQFTRCSLAQDVLPTSVPPCRRPCAAEDVRYPIDAFLSSLKESGRRRKRDAAREDIDRSGGLPNSCHPASKQL
jgi:hypothetical protein